MATIEQQRIPLSNLIPTMLNLMLKHPRVGEFDYSSLRVVLSGGAPIAPQVVKSITAAFNCDYIQTYGMTETSPYLTNGFPVITQEGAQGSLGQAHTKAEKVQFCDTASDHRS